MTLALDTSALVTRYLREPGTDAVIDAMARDPRWVVLTFDRRQAAAARRLGLLVAGIDDDPDGD